MTSAETSPGGTTQTANGSSDIEQLQTQIEQTREELAETLDALGAKLDVKSRAKAKVRSTTEQARAGVEVGRDHVVQVTSKAVNAATDDNGRPSSCTSVAPGLFTAAWCATP